MTKEAKQMIEYILRRIRKPALVIDENTPLVSSGLVDSMALGEVMLTLEDLTNTRIPPGKVKPKIWTRSRRCSRPHSELENHENSWVRRQ